MSLIKVPIGNAISYNNFNGEQILSFKSPSLKWIIPYKSYMSMRIRVTQTGLKLDPATNRPIILPGLRPYVNDVDDAGNPSTVTIPYLNSNPITAFFTSLKTDVGNYQATIDDSLPAGNKMFKINTRTKDEEERVEPNNKISYISLEEAYTARIYNAINTDFQDYFPGFDATSVKLSKRQLHVMRNNLFGLNNTHEIELTGSIPCPLFNSRSPIPPHTPITLKFLTDNINFSINLINFAGSQTASANATNGFNTTATPAVAIPIAVAGPLTIKICSR